MDIGQITNDLDQYQLDNIPQSLDGGNLIDNLRFLGASAQAIHNVFDNSGALRTFADISNLLILSPDELLETMLSRLNSHYELQQVVLNRLIPTGFNDHGPTHIQRVTKQTQRILKELGSDKIVQKIAIVASCCHDLGNIIDRKQHHIWSCLLAKLILGLNEEDPIHQSILESIYYHEEKAHHDQNLIQKLSFSALALILADKTDVSYLRVHTVSDQKEAVNDLHVIINFMIDNSKLTFYETKVQWRLLFNPSADRVSELFQNLLKRGERKWVPKQWQKMYRSEQIEYVFIYYAKILQVYLDRIRLSAISSLILFPRSNKFEFVVEDQERHVVIKREFHRDTAEDQIKELRDNLTKNI